VGSVASEAKTFEASHKASRVAVTHGCFLKANVATPLTLDQIPIPVCKASSNGIRIAVRQLKVRSTKAPVPVPS
jgi:hypothetical protein